MTEIQARNKVVNTAVAFIGFNEVNHQDDIIIKKFNQIRDEGSYKMGMDDAWCAAFGSVVGNLAGFSGIIPIDCSCEGMIAKFKKLGCWNEDGTIIPKIGDYIFYNWDDATQPNDGWADHVGIVVGVIGRLIKVIEGNKNDAVEYRSISVGWGYIRGYGQPNYSKVASEVTVVKPTYAIGDYVMFNGTKHYTASDSSGKSSVCKPGKAQITVINTKGVHKYHLIGIGGSTVYGWVDESDISGTTKPDTKSSPIKKGDIVSVTKAVTYTGKSFKTHYDKYDVIEVAGDRVVIGKGKTVTCAINVKNIKKA